MYDGRVTLRTQLADAVATAAATAALIAELTAAGGFDECADLAVPDLIASLVGSIDSMSAAVSVAVHRVDRCGVLRGQGFASTKSWMGLALRWDRRHCASTLRTARLLGTSFTATRDAWLRGDIQAEHATVIVNGLAKIVTAVEPALQNQARSESEAVLLHISTDYNVEYTTAALKRIRSAVDPDGARAAAVEANGKQWCRLTPVADGWLLAGWLDHLTGAALATVLDGRRNTKYHNGQHHNQHDSAEHDSAEHGSASDDSDAAPSEDLPYDDADAARRINHQNALILSEIAHELLAGGHAGTIGGERPHVELIITLAELAAGIGTGELTPGSGSNEPTPINIETAQMITCDSDVRRITTTGTHYPPATTNQTKTGKNQATNGRAKQRMDPAIARILAAPSGLLR